MRILITGCSAMQVNSDRKVNQLISNLESIKLALESMHHEVHWRAVTVGEPLTEFDHVIVCLMPFASWGSRYMGGALWAYFSHPAVTLTADDWQVRGIQSSAFAMVKRPDYFEKTIWSHWVGKCDEMYKPNLQMAIKWLSATLWPGKMLVPCWTGGDLSKLKLPAEELIAYDPSPFMKAYKYKFSHGKNRSWVLASLTAKDKALHDFERAAMWPIQRYGNVRQGQVKLPEDALAQVYAVNWGVMSPKHDVSAAGWFRVRFWMAAHAGCVMACGTEEAAILGKPYQLTIPHMEKCTENDLEGIANSQFQALVNISWSSGRLCDVIDRAISR